MMAKGDEDGFNPKIEAEASDWLAKQDRGLTPREQDAFLDWLAADPEHGKAYRFNRSVMQRLDVLAEWKPEHSRRPNPALLASKSARRPSRWMAAAGALAALVTLLAGAAYYWMAASASDGGDPVLLTSLDGATGYERHLLDDGSMVELNRGAIAKVTYSSAERRVDLLAGEAHFTVERDSARPFVVHAGKAEVVAVGTAFNVSLEGKEIEVLVTEGRVRVVAPRMVGPEQDRSAALGKDLGQEVVAGQRSRVPLFDERTMPLVETVDSAEIERRLGWKSITFDFLDAPLEEVVGAFNRRNKPQLVVSDPAISNLPITATLRSSNIEGFVELLELTMGIEAEREGEAKIYLRKGVR